MMSAKPTAASAAATPIEKITNMIPVSASGCSPKRQNAMKFRFAALSMSSMPMSTMMALRRVSAPARPMANRNAERMRYPASGVMSVVVAPDVRRGIFFDRCSGTVFVPPPHVGGYIVAHRNNHRANQRRRQQQADDFERQHVFSHQRVADLFDGGFGLRRQIALDHGAFGDGPSQNAENGECHANACDRRRRKNFFL